jgi:hypothetical protein
MANNNAAEIKNQLHKSTKATQSQVLRQFQQFIFPAFQAINVELDEDALAAAFKPKMAAVPALYYLIASTLSDSDPERLVRGATNINPSAGL